ncbi:MAG: hypothetical protein CBC13_11900 [Planctomycetia bacterium TMED53]|nr:MAG: hypothetical protein CBC13_11900 [Planctomycetia bacterium TMED53]
MRLFSIPVKQQEEIMKLDRLLYLLLLSLCCVGVAVPSHAQDVPVSSPYFKQAYYTNPDGGALSYQIMIPEELRVDRKYPLVLVLHGRGGKSVAGDVLAIDSLRADFPCFVVAPVSGTKAVWARPESWTEANWLDRPERISDVIAMIEGMIQSSPIDPDRIYVTGQSMGGIGTFGIISKRPDLFAAAVPLCGGWDPDSVASFKDVPMWIFHGAKDKVIPPVRSQVMVEALKEAGANVKYTEHPEAGHNIFRLTYGDPELWKWLFEQKKTAESADDPMQKWLEFMTPGQEHELLKARVGRWKVENRQWMEPGQEPVETSMVSENELAMGGRYLLQRVLPMDYNGMPFEARGFIGYDNGKKCFVSSWIDSFGTGIATGIGKRSENEAEVFRVIEWTWTLTDPLSGKDSKIRAVETIISEDEFRFDMFTILPDGTEMKSMEQIARREKKE